MVLVPTVKMVFDWYDHGRHATATIQPGEIEAAPDPGVLLGERVGEHRYLWYVQARDWVHDPDGRRLFGIPARIGELTRSELGTTYPLIPALESVIARYGRSLDLPVRMELGRLVTEQPPEMNPDANMFGVMLWSLKMRWWAGSVAGTQDDIEPDVRIFVRYHAHAGTVSLENSVGLQKGMVGVVNGYAGRRFKSTNNVIIAHEFLHTLGATDKYRMDDGQPIGPDGLAEPQREPLYPQRYAAIMGGDRKSVV